MSSEPRNLSKAERVAAIVVTYNRKDLLRCSLQSLLEQTRLLDEIIVIDNLSTDGTDEMLTREFAQVMHMRMAENVGGAGGFFEGIKRAYERGHDWVWIMDDDTVPDPDALEVLLTAGSAVSEQPGFLCSHVVWTDGATHIMNVVQVADQAGPYAAKGIMATRSCSFVSALVSRCAIKAVGLPIKEMFIYGDDQEYTERISRRFPCYYVPQSRAVHMTKTNTGANLRTAPADQLWKYFYDGRNKVYRFRQNGWRSLAKYGFEILPRDVWRALTRDKNKIPALSVYLKGAAVGWWFRPKVTRL